MKPITELKKLEDTMYSRLKNMKANNSEIHSSKIRTRERPIANINVKSKNNKKEKSDVMVLHRVGTTKNRRIVVKQENNRPVNSCDLREKKLNQQRTITSILEHDQMVARAAPNTVIFLCKLKY